jgi:hypothetical protein
MASICAGGSLGILYDTYLPELVARQTSQHQEIQLLVKMTIRRFKRGFIYLGNLS